MSIKGFSVGGVVQRYDYTALDNLPQGQGVSDDLKAALLQLAQKVAYIDDQGQTYYDDLYDALYPEKTLLSITANFQQGQAVIYNTDSLDTLKQYLTVTAVYDDASTELVPSSAYTLSGTLTTGTSVITVTYEGKTDAFNVTVTAAPMSFPVTNNLTGCTTSNSASNVAEGSTYNAVITASSDYTLVGATVSITMGGQDITTSAYSGGVITISNVTGALVIAVSAVAVVLESISAAYTQSGTVYDTDTLDSLKADLVVTATYSDSSTQTVPAAYYALSGTLTVGTSTITVSYGGKTTTFSVTVSEESIPSDYQQVEYLEATQTSSSSGGYINTGVNPPEHTTLQFVAGFMPSGTQPTASTAQYIISTRETATGSTNNVGFTIQISGAMDAIGSFSGNPGAYISQATINKRFDVTATWTAASLTVSDGETTVTEEYATRGCVGYPICVFGLKKAANAQYTNTFNGRIYYAKVYSDGSLIVDMVPCYRKSDNVIGMYNKVTGSFRTASGSAAVFTAGPDVT